VGTIYRIHQRRRRLSQPAAFLFARALSSHKFVTEYVGLWKNRKKRLYCKQHHGRHAAGGTPQFARTP